MLLPFGYSNSDIVRLSPLLIVAVLSARFYLNKSVFSLIKVNQTLVFFSIIIVAAIFRNNNPVESKLSANLYLSGSFILFVSFFAAASYFFFNKPGKEASKNVVFFIILPFALFAIANWVLYLLKIKVLESSSVANESTTQSLLLAGLGININRIEFPLVKGINSYSIYVGGVLALSLPLFLWSKKYRLITGASSFIFLITLLSTDSRGAFIYPVLISAFIFFFKKKENLSKRFRLLSFLVVVGPLFFLTILSLAANVKGLEFLSRSDEDFKTGNSRLIIWGFSLAEFLNFKLVHIFGYGLYGHYGSGASKLWAYLFSGYKDPELSASSHSSFFTLLFDYGYVGLITYITLLYQQLSKIIFIWKQQPLVASAFLSFMLYNIIAGITEAVGGMNLLNYMFLFFMVCIAVNTKYYTLKNNVALAPVKKNIK